MPRMSVMSSAPARPGIAVPEMRKPVRVLFDESHGEAWTIRPEVAAAIQPSHPEDASYARAAAALRARDFAVAAHTAGPLTEAALADVDVLVIAHPSDPKWEAVVPGGSPRLAAAELEAIEAFVSRGGGLVLLGETEQDKYGSNLPDLAARFGVTIASATVHDYERSDRSPHWVLADLDARRREVDLLARVREVCFYRATTLDAPSDAVIARAAATSSAPGAPLLAVVPHEAGRVVVSGDSDLFGDDCLGEHDHEALWLNLFYWVAEHRFASGRRPVGSGVEATPAWARLKTATARLRLLQAKDGSVDTGVHARAELDALVETLAGAVADLAPSFPHQAAYCEAVVADLRRWAAEGYGAPDFGPSLEAFRPDRRRVDGAEHLVLFPMYKQNGSRDKVFEALLVEVPWPDWIAALEAQRYDNAKYLPVRLLDHTAGYDSECAVLFPETVSVAGKPVNHFGGIFCDREAERFSRVGGAAASLLGLNLPPDAAALLASEELAQQAFMLWDLVHDRTHARGDLPFDPFMIRQRMPYWMYSLEELRCDLTAFGEAVALEREGFAFARHVQYAILFDRLFRFPITGTRVRNYDGLGGQLLFAYLHKHGHVRWTDNQLTIDWEHVAEGVMALRAEVETLYRDGIDKSKVAYWGAAHDLVSTYVTPATDSAWVKGVRAFPDAEDPRPYIDEVRDDEFPLSIFYVSLRQKLADALERLVAAGAAA